MEIGPPLTGPGNMTPEMVEEHKKDKEESRQRQVLSDALYALNNIQKLMVMDADRITGNPKMVEVLTQVRAGIDQLITGQTTLPGVEPVGEGEEEPEAEEDTGSGPLEESRARRMARGMGFGRPMGRGSAMAGGGGY